MPRPLPILFNNNLDLDQLDVASPCHAAWEDMVGSDRVRFCGSCQKNVFNVSGMRRDEATELLRATEGKICVRFFRRADGTILTEDCPVGIRLVLRRAKRATLIAAATTVGAVAAMIAMLGFSVTKRASCQLQTLQTNIEQIVPEIPQPEIEMGKVAPEPRVKMGEYQPPPEKPVQKMGRPAIREFKGDAAWPVEVKGNVAAPKAEVK